MKKLRNFLYSPQHYFHSRVHGVFKCDDEGHDDDESVEAPRNNSKDVESVPDEA